MFLGSVPDRNYSKINFVLMFSLRGKCLRYETGRVGPLCFRIDTTFLLWAHVFWRFGDWDPSNPMCTAIPCRAAQSLPQTDGYVFPQSLHAMAMPWPCHGQAMAMPCHGHAMAMPWPWYRYPNRCMPWRGYAPANPPETSVLEKVTCTSQQMAKVVFCVDETLVWNNPPDPPDPANPLQSKQNGVENRRPGPPFDVRRGSG